MPANHFFDRRIMCISLLYLCAGIFLLVAFGVQTGGEAEKYIDNAHRIINGSGLRNGVYGFFYLSYSLITAFFIKLSIPFFFLGLFQLLLSLAAAYCIYLLAASYSKRLALVAFIAYLCCYPVQKWNFFLYSESLHTSLLVIGLYFFSRFINLPSAKRGAVLLLLLVLIFFSRPTGIVFLFTVFFSVLYWLWKKNRRPVFYISSLVFLACISLAISSPLIAFVNPDSLVRLEVICQVSGIDQNKDYLEFQRSGLGEIYKTIRDDIGIRNFLWTGCKKIFAFFSMYREYYSLPNNLLLVANWVFYPFALIGIFSKPEPALLYVKFFSVCYLILISFVVFFTCDDWANRFIAPAFPFILLLALMGIGKLFHSIRKA